MNTRRAITTLLLIIAGLITGQLVRAPGQTATIAVQAPGPAPDDGLVMVTKVIDGDTIELAGGEKVRYIGMDTPETVHPSKPVQCFGHEASEYNRTLVEGHRVRLTADVEATDHYGRSLRYVYLADGTFVNLDLVSRGYARAYPYPPNTAHKQEFAAAQAQARQNSQGLWGSCNP